MFMARNAAEMEPVSRIISNRSALPGPIIAPAPKTILSRRRAGSLAKISALAEGAEAEVGALAVTMTESVKRAGIQGNSTQHESVQRPESALIFLSVLYWLSA